MLDNTWRSQIVHEVRRIGDELLSRADSHAYGTSWPTLALAPTDSKRLLWRTSPSLYKGVAGIVLFFLELYKHVRHDRYLHAACEGMRWVEHYCHHTPLDSYAFLSGRVGAAYAMAQIAAVTGEHRFIDRALHMVQPASSTLFAAAPAADVINGTAGMVLGLLHLYEASGARWLLDTIDAGIQRLLQQACFGPQGVYWDRSPHIIRGLCGFSHGAAGIGWVFLALGQYFHNAAFVWLAEQAFAYESVCYNELQQNWPDFRKGIFEPADYEQHYAAYVARDRTFFTAGGDMNAWCHGAAGVGLSRLRAYALLQKACYKQDVENAIAKTMRTDVDETSPAQSLSLCHGRTGNAELFIEAYRLLQEERYLALAAHMAANILRGKRAHGCYISGYRSGPEDTSLFLGNAGIGYFYLRVLDPELTPSILAPWVTSRLTNPQVIATYRSLTMTVGELQKVLMEHAFPRTLSVMEHQSPAHMHRYFADEKAPGRTALPETFVASTLHALAAMPAPTRERLVDVVHLESARARLEAAIPSYAWLYMQEIAQTIQTKELLALDEEAFLQLQLTLAPDITICVQHWEWPATVPQHWQQNFRSAPGQYPVLLRPTSRGVVETPLTALAYTILTAFRHEVRVAHAMLDVVMQCEPGLSPDQETAVRQSILGQIRAALAGGILAVVEE